MSVISNTAHAGLSSGHSRRLVVLALVVALAVAALTVTIVLLASGSSGSVASTSSGSGTAQHGPVSGTSTQHLGTNSQTQAGTVGNVQNYLSQHSGARP